ncbi:hypothetical protein ACWEPC_54705 [Nonomuraea sp. NPDC004297]
MGKTNVANGGYTAIQVGHVGTPDEAETATDHEPTPPHKDGKGRTANVQAGRARVGAQADTIVGDITVIL